MFLLLLSLKSSFLFSGAIQNNTIKQIVPGYYHTCAITGNDKLKCWGYNQYGQLGLGDAVTRGIMQSEIGENLKEVDLGKNAKVLKVALGTYHTCALISQNNLEKIKCWGYNIYGQLGRGDKAARGTVATEMGDNLPSVDLGSGSPTDIVAGGYSSCAVLKQANKNKVKCWGYNAYGQLGLGDKNNRGDEANEMSGNLKEIDFGTNVEILKIATWGYASCALLEQNTMKKIKCWGNNANGQLGLGDKNNRGDEAGEMGNSLAFINLGTNAVVVGLSVGFNHNCATIRQNNQTKMKCWGYNGYGQLGMGDTNIGGDEANEMGDNLKEIDFGTQSVLVEGVAGGYHNCALLKEGSKKKIKCWGYNFYGQLGIENNTNQMLVSKDTLSTDVGLPVISIAAGGFHTCALTINNLAKCWGMNRNGQLGIGIGTNKDMGTTQDQMGTLLPFVEIF